VISQGPLHFSDIKTIHDGMAEKVSMVIQYLSMTIGGLIIGFLYAWKLALVTLAVAPVIGIASGLVMVVSTILYRHKDDCIVSEFRLYRMFQKDASIVLSLSFHIK